MPDEGANADKKTFLEQLRLINLSVVATCLLLFVGVGVQSSSMIEGAYKEVQSIRENAPRFVDWLRANRADIESQLSFLQTIAPLKFYAIPVMQTGNVLAPLKDVGNPMVCSGNLMVDVASAQLDAKRQKMAFPFITKNDVIFKDSLEYFIRVWNRSYSALAVTSWELDHAEAITSNPMGQHITFSLLPPKNVPVQHQWREGIRLDGIPAWSASERRWNLAVESSCGDPAPMNGSISMHIPLVTVAQPFQVRAVEYLKNVQWAPGTFDQSFRDLNRISQHLDSLNLEQLEEHINTLRVSSDSVDIFGAKLPVDFLRTWGVVILLSVQLYYYLHLRQFHKLFGSERLQPSFAWIACYDDRLSRSIYYVSVTVLPASTAVYLLVSQRSDLTKWPDTVFGVGAVSASLIGAFLTGRETGAISWAFARWLRRD